MASATKKLDIFFTIETTPRYPKAFISTYDTTKFKACSNVQSFEIDSTSLLKCSLNSFKAEYKEGIIGINKSKHYSSFLFQMNLEGHVLELTQFRQFLIQFGVRIITIFILLLLRFCNMTRNKILFHLYL